MNQSAQLGVQKMEWAWNYMPVLRQIQKDYQKEQPFQGCKIIVCCHLEAKTGNLARLIKDLGGEVWVAGSNPLSTQDEIAEALREYYGMIVHAEHTQNLEVFIQNSRKVLSLGPNLIMDDGGDLATMIHMEKPDLLFELVGISEETTTGVQRLRALEEKGMLKVPAIAANDAMMKYLFDNRYGTGQSTWDGIIRNTNIGVAAKIVVVAGYGWCGKGVAMRAKGLGAHVIVTEVDSVKAIEALMDGFQVMTMDQAAALGDIFVTVTGNIDVLTQDHFLKMKEGAILANSGHFDVEISMNQLREVSCQTRQVRQNVCEYSLPNGVHIYVIGEGRLVNLAAADGHPIEIMDTSFAIQCMSLLYLWKNRGKLDNRLMKLPDAIDYEVAFLKLRSMGVNIDTLSDRQRAYMSSY